MKEYDDLKNRVENLERKVQRLLKDRGDRNISNFEITGDGQWDHIERNLLQKGVILEHEISKKLKDLDIEHTQNYSFLYPSDKGKFMIDYQFSNENEFCRFPDSDDIKSRRFETDIYIDKKYKYSDENFNISITFYYLIECKSRANPPINYLFIPNKVGLEFKEPKKSFFQLKGSKFLPFLNLYIDPIWRTDQNIIQIKYPRLDLDNKETLNEAFWQLFRRIDYERNNMHFFTPFNLNFLNIDYFKKFIPEDFELPQYFNLFKIFYDKLEENNIIDKILKEKIDLKISIYIPIIVVNGNIYSIDLEKNMSAKEKFSKCVKKEPGFIKRYDYLEMPKNEGEKFIDFTRFLMDNLIDIGITDRGFFPIKFRPALDVLVISSSHFSETFFNIKEQLESLIPKRIEELAKNLLLINREEIVRLLMFDWMLLNSSNFLSDFTSFSYKKYREFREKNWRSSILF